MMKNAHIKKAIEHAGTQKELARRAGLSQAAISKLLIGGSRPSAETAIAIEKATGGEVSRHALRPDVFGDSVV